MQLQRLDTGGLKERLRFTVHSTDMQLESPRGSTAGQEGKEALVREDSRSTVEGGYSSHTY